MCGIAGIWHGSSRSVDGAALRRMTSALTHRGPDEEGFHLAPGIGLGHRRLAIIDPGGGQQPLCNEDGSIWVVLNGEIFNYRELRQSLESRGHCFRTRSDTEILVHLYEEKGLDFVADLNGQFAIALWDQPRRRLVLARDRVGIRPLFHATLPDGTALFGSEMKALFAHGAVQPEIDPIAVGQIATLWVSVPPRTAFKGVAELAPGRLLVLEDGRRTEVQYWRHRFPAMHEFEERSIDYWQERVRELLHDAVRLQLRADVPVAAYLSGGLDSTILATLAQQELPAGLTTFSVGFADARFDERVFQSEVAAQLRTRHHQIEVNAADLGASFADVVWFSERPMVRTAPAALLRLSELVRRHGIKVVLTGEGSDEIFGGYNIFREDKARRFWARNPRSAWRSRVLSGLYGYVSRDRRADAAWRLFFRDELGNTSDPYYSHRVRWRNCAQIRRLFTSAFRAGMQDDEALTAELDGYLGRGHEQWHPLCRAQYLEMSLFMSGYLLSSQGDRMLMGHSVEGRMPFLDHRLIELAALIPPKFKLRAMREKYILRRSFAHLVPPAVLARPKQPYRAPISACFAGNASNLAARLLRREALQQTAFADPDGVGKLLHRAGTAGAALSERDEMAVAMMASLQLLHHLFVATGRPVRAGVIAPAEPRQAVLA